MKTCSKNNLRRFALAPAPPPNKLQYYQKLFYDAGEVLLRQPDKIGGISVAHLFAHSAAVPELFIGDLDIICLAMRAGSCTSWRRWGSWRKTPPSRRLSASAARELALVTIALRNGVDVGCRDSTVDLLRVGTEWNADAVIGISVLVMIKLRSLIVAVKAGP